ncbi:hypothetical protein P7C70_g1556, partial [Phenoliferia sp. Uapishka_3]
MLSSSNIFKQLRRSYFRGFTTSVPQRSYADTIHALGVAPDARVVVTGFTGKASTFHSEIALKFGTNIVGGTSPTKGGTKYLGLPVFSALDEAVSELRPDVALIFVPALAATQAILEAIKAEVPLIVSVAEGIPAHDQMRIHQVLQSQSKSRLVGANCPGVAGRSGTLTYEASFATSQVGLGQSFVFGLGGDLYPGTSTVEALQYLLVDEHTNGKLPVENFGLQHAGEAKTLLVFSV